MINDNIEPKKFQYTLDIRGVETEVLTNSPQEWLDTKVEYKRSDNGIIRSLTLPFNFPFKAATLLRKEFYKYFLLARVNLKIAMLTPETWAYNDIYLGKVDFSQFKDNETGVTVNIKENTFAVKLDAYDKQKYAIPVDFDSPESIKVELTPLTVTETADFTFSSNIDQRSDAFFEMEIVTNQQNAKLASVQRVGFYADSNPVWSTDSHWFYIARTNTNVRYKGHLEGLVIPQPVAGVQTYKILVYKSDGTLINELYSVSTSTGVGFNFDFDFTTSVLEGERLFIYFSREGSTNSDYGFRLTNSTLSLEYDTKTDATFCKALRCDYVFQQLVNKMNGGVTYPAVSYLLSNTLKQLVITCSDSIRQTNNVGSIYKAGDTLQIGGRYLVKGGAITYAGVLRPIDTYFNYALGYEEFTTLANGFVKQVGQNPSLSLSFEDFYQSIYSIMGGAAGIGCEANRVVIEELSYFYRPGLGVLRFGDAVNDVEFLPATDLLWNKIKVGYPDQQYDRFNGLREVNSTQYYGTDLEEPDKELNLVSVIRADPYGIEQVRVVPTDTAASRSDNDNFFIYLKPAPEIGQTYYRPLRMEGLQSISGASEEYYNWYISPKHNLLRGGAYLHSILYQMSGYKIKLTDSKKNISMVTIDLNGVRVAEGEDIEISRLPAPIFIPIYATLTPASIYNAMQLLESTPYADIWFNYRGIGLKGFINGITIDAGENSAQQFKLLMTADNNLELLNY